MCASCFKYTLHKRHIAETLQHTIVGNCRFPYSRIRRKDCHTEPVFRIPSYISFYASLVFLEVSPYKGIITAVCCLVEELHSQFCLCQWCLCHYKQSTGVFVYTMYESYFRIIGIIVWYIFKMPSHSVYQCAMIVAASRMHHHPCWFVYNHQFGVFVDDVKRNIFRLYATVVLRTVEHKGYHVEGTHLIVALYRFLVYMYKARIGSSLYTVSACVLKLLRHELVNAQRHLSFVYDYAQMFIELSVFVFRELFFCILYYIFCHSFSCGFIPVRLRLQIHRVRHCLLSLLGCGVGLWRLQSHCRFRDIPDPYT